MNSEFIFVDDIANGLENIKISFQNAIDSERLPSNVMYITCCVLKSELLVEDFESIQKPCRCTNECGTDPLCFCTLGGAAYKDRKLIEEYCYSTSKPILECSKLCSCSKTCPNRVVQCGITFSLQVFKTKSKGFGVRTLEFIPKMSFVCEYAGEILDQEEAKKRMDSLTKNDPNYIFVLKEHCSQKLKTIIDPTLFGNVGRYLNHSCCPNLVVVPVRANSMVPRLCFFAKRDVLPMEELCYHYSGSEEPKDLNCSAKVCCCESKNCTGFVPFDTDWIN